MELKTHEQITEHLRTLRKILTSQHGWTLERMADELRVKKHTLSQYCQWPDTKGARLPPPGVLSYLRSAVVDLDRKRWDKFFPTYLGREEKTWFVLDTDMSISLETHSLFAASMHAARFDGLTVAPGPENTNPDEQLLDDQRLCVEWTQIVESGFVGRDDVVEVTGAGEYELHLIACEQVQWRVQPTEAQVRALRQKAREGYARHVEERRHLHEAA